VEGSSAESIDSAVWLAAGHDPKRPELPHDRVASSLLKQLGVDPRDVSAVIAARPGSSEQSTLWGVLNRDFLDTLHNMGSPASQFVAWGSPATHSGNIAQNLPVWTFLATLPHVRRYHSRCQVPDEISWASLGFLGTAITRHRKRTGTTGVGPTGGLPLIARGVSYRLGRLAFDRHATAPGPAQRQVDAPRECSLRTHIPGDSGRLEPQACTDAFAAARSFFRSRFPEQITSFSCRSWVMDDQLGNYLPGASNIIRFQQRFTSFTDVVAADWAPLDHVFSIQASPDAPPNLLDGLSQATTLERAVVTHLRAGRHWYLRTGWLPTGSDPA